MIVRTYKSSDSVMVFQTSVSREIIRAADKVGHVLYDTTIRAGTSDSVFDIYAESFDSQAHYCLAGEGAAIVDGREYPVRAGTLVAASRRGNIVLKARTDMRICTILGDQAATRNVIVRSIDDIVGTERDVFWGNGRSRRLLVKDDGLGFALCVTLGNPNTDSALQYRNHFESCYYISGSGEYVWESGSHPIDTDKSFSTVFIMDQNDAHRMVVRDESVCLSIFTPPIEGHEKHDLSGQAASSY